MSKARRRDFFLRVIDLCRTVEEGRVDPFTVDVPQIFERLRPLLSQSRSREEAYLDIEVVLGLAGVVCQQGAWIKHRSSLLYLDPLLVMVRLQGLSKKDLAEIFLKAWHPIASLESLSPGGMEEAVRYWENLAPLNERGVDFETGERPTTLEAPRENLLDKGVIPSQRFLEKLEDFWRELRVEAGEKGEIDYWGFIQGDTYKKTVKRAYLTSFLITYGYATLEIDPLEERFTLRPTDTPPHIFVRGGVSLPISIPRDRWEEDSR